LRAIGALLESDANNLFAIVLTELIKKGLETFQIVAFAQ
jgi:hypothetical protein